MKFTTSADTDTTFIRAHYVTRFTKCDFPRTTAPSASLVPSIITTSDGPTKKYSAAFMKAKLKSGYSKSRKKQMRHSERTSFSLSSLPG